MQLSADPAGHYALLVLTQWRTLLLGRHFSLGDIAEVWHEAVRRQESAGNAGLVVRGPAGAAVY